MTVTILYYDKIEKSLENKICLLLHEHIYKNLTPTSTIIKAKDVDPARTNSNRDMNVYKSYLKNAISAYPSDFDIIISNRAVNRYSYGSGIDSTSSNYLEIAHSNMSEIFPVIFIANKKFTILPENIKYVVKKYPGTFEWEFKQILDGGPFKVNFADCSLENAIIVLKHQLKKYIEQNCRRIMVGLKMPDYEHLSRILGIDAKIIETYWLERTR